MFTLSDTQWLVLAILGGAEVLACVAYCFFITVFGDVDE